MAFDAGAIKSRMVLDKSQWDKSTREIRTSQQRMVAQTKKTGTAMKGMWKQIAVGVGITNLISMGIRAVTRQMSDTIKVGRSFEREWANVTTMLDISRSATEQMKEELKALSPTLGDTTELAKGMYQVLSASIEPAKAIRFLGEAAKSAKAGVTDTKTAVDAMTTVINAYGMEAEAAGEVSDIMFGIVKRGKVTYEELAQSLGTVVPIAATVGVNFKDLGAAVATLTRQGVNASKATMQLRQVLMLILDPSDEAREVAEDLEIGMGKMALETKGLAGWLTELKEKTKDSSDAIFKIIPNARALTATLALVGKASQGYADDQVFLQEVMGFTDEAFRKQMESVDFWVETFEVAADKIKIAIFEGLTSQLRESIRTTEDFDETVTEATNSAANAVSLHVSMMVENLQSLIKAFRAAGKIIEPVRNILSGWLLKLLEGKDATDDLKKATNNLRDAMLQVVPKGAIEDIEGFTEANEYLKISIDEMLEPIDVMARATKVFTGRLKELTEFEGIFDALTPPSELMERWDAFYDLVETPELDLIWEQQMSNMEQDTLNFMAKIIPGMAFMTEEIKKKFKGLGKDVKLTLGDAIMEAGAILTRMGQHSKALAYAGAIVNTAMAVTQALRAYPPPISFVMAALQAAAGLAEITTIKSTAIPTAEKGAFLATPTVIEAGHGPMGEIISPVPMMKEVFKETILETGGGTNIDFNFYAPIISTTGIASSDLDRVSEELFHKMETEARRRGYSLNGS